MNILIIIMIYIYIYIWFLAVAQRGSSRDSAARPQEKSPQGTPPNSVHAKKKQSSLSLSLSLSSCLSLSLALSLSLSLYIYIYIYTVPKTGGRVLLTEMLLPRIARQGAVCLASIRGSARTTLEVRNLSSLRVSNRTANFQIKNL